jgi:hypothetical protein
VFDELVIELVEFAVLAGIDGVIDNSAGSQELVEVKPIEFIGIVG